MEKTGWTFLKTSAYATIAQAISLCVSICLSLLLPKFISIENYAYWQLFVLYSSYVGLLHLGFNDGLYLKLGGTKFINIDTREWTPQYILVFILQLIGAVLLAFFAFQCISSPIKQEIIYLLSIYIVIENCYKILGFTLMATDGMIFYSKTVIVDKILLLILLFGILFNIIPVLPTTVIQCFIITHIIALILLLLRFKNFFHQWYKLSFKGSIAKMANNMVFGVILTISNLLGSFIIGSGRFFVEYYWSIETFAKISLAVSISMFTLVFISQIGLVLFPLLRNINQNKQKILLDKGVFLLGIVSLCFYLLFFPIYGLIEVWLPKYTESLTYLVFLFPISLYEIKSSILYFPYFKNLNKQKILCVINLVTVLLAVMLYWIAISIQSIEMIVLTMLLAVAFKSIALQLYLFKHYSIRLNSYFFIEILITILFILSFKLLGIGYLLLIYILSIIVILTYYRKKLIKEYFFIKQSLK